MILAYDHEGTEAAEWLAKNGVTGIVLKYRVPARDKDKHGSPPCRTPHHAHCSWQSQGVGH